MRFYEILAHFMNFMRCGRPANGKNKKEISFFKDELGGKITTGFAGLRPKTWAYLMDDDSKKKKAKGKKCLIKRGLMFKNFKDCVLNNKIILKSQQRFKSDCHNVYTEQINMIALSSNDDKRLETFNKTTTYPHRTNAFKVCESKMMIVKDSFVEKYTDCPFYDEIILQSQQRFKSGYRTNQ